MKNNEGNGAATGAKQFIRPQISLQECKAILNKNGQKYTDEEIKQIREDLLVLIEIDYYHFLKCMKKENELHTDEEKVIPLHPEQEELRKAS